MAVARFLQRFFDPAEESAGDHPAIIADVTAMAGTGGARGGSEAQRQLQTLDRLSSFAGREEIPVTAVLERDEPLRKVPDGQPYKGIDIVYAGAGGLARELRKLIKSNCRGRSAVIVTSRPEVEQAATDAGAGCIRASTFQKAVGNDGGSGRQSRSRRRPRRREGGSRNRSQKPEKKGSEEDRIINELIDTV
jgi:hypothetical protein